MGIQRGIITGFFFTHLNGIMVCVIHIHLGLYSLLINGIRPRLLFTLNRDCPRPPPHFRLMVEERGMFRLFTHVTQVGKAFMGVLRGGSRDLSVYVCFSKFPGDPITSVVQHVTFKILQGETGLVASRGGFWF